MTLTPYAKNLIAKNKKSKNTNSSSSKSSSFNKKSSNKKLTYSDDWEKTFGTNPHTTTIYTDGKQFRKKTTLKKKAKIESETIAQNTQTEAISKPILGYSSAYNQNKNLSIGGIPLSAFKPVANKVKAEEKQKNNAYNIIDKGLFFGYLPGGVTPTETRAQNTQQKAEDYKKLLEAQKKLYNEKLQEAINKENSNISIDLVSEKGLESLGLFQSEQEKAIQEMMQQEQFYRQQAQQAQQTEQAKQQVQQTYKDLNIPIPEYPQETGFLSNVFSNNDTKSALLIGGIVLGTYLLTK